MVKLCHARPAPGRGPLASVLELFGPPTRHCATCGSASRVAHARLYHGVTVLDRSRKSFVTRHKDGRAFLYRPRIGRAQWLGERAARVLAAEDGGTTAVLAAFLDSAERADPNIVSDLAELIAKRRQNQKKGP